MKFAILFVILLLAGLIPFVTVTSAISAAHSSMEVSSSHLKTSNRSFDLFNFDYTTNTCTTKPYHSTTFNSTSNTFVGQELSNSQFCIRNTSRHVVTLNWGTGNTNDAYSFSVRGSGSIGTSMFYVAAQNFGSCPPSPTVPKPAQCSFSPIGSPAFPPGSTPVVLNPGEDTSQYFASYGQNGALELWIVWDGTQTAGMIKIDVTIIGVNP